MGVRKYYLGLVLAFACCHCAFAQVPGNEEKSIASPPINSASPAHPKKDTSATPHEAKFRVRTIYITGNRITRNDFMLREIPFKQGEAYLLQELVKKFEDARRQLMNTTLFHTVVVALKSFDGYDVDVLVDVRERWYIFPLPYFKPVDRNINQWIIEQKGSLSRVNYGAKLLYNNVSGRNDKMRIWLMNGYSKQLSFGYDRLYIDKKMKWGMSVGFSMGKNHEVNYNTINDKQVFLKDDGYVRNFLNTAFELTYRRATKTRHRFGIAYNTEKISDTVVKLNSAYFSSSRSRVSYPEIYYIMSYYDVDYIPYPTTGYAAEVAAGKKGINSTVNLWQLSVKGSGFWPTGKRTFFSLNTYGTIKLPFKQPFYTQRMLGYNDAFLQGYEYYVIDGVATGYLKAMFTRRLAKFDIRLRTGKKRGAQQIPFTIYGKVYGNTGYVYNPQPGDNSLSNKMLYSCGFGIDVFTFYDFTMKLEWSFNQLGQNGLFLHKKTLF